MSDRPSKPQLQFLPRCPACEAKLPAGRMLTFDTRQVLVCPVCDKRLQIDMRMTTVDWLIQTLIYAPLLVYGLAVCMWLTHLLPNLMMMIYVLWFMTLLVLGRVIWRIFCPHITEWEPKCLNCSYDLRGLDHHVCPECGKDNNPQHASTLDVGIADFFRYVILCSVGSFVVFGVIALIWHYLNNGILRLAGFPFGVEAIPDLGRAMFVGGQMRIAGYDWRWEAFCNDLSLCVLTGFLLAVILMRYHIQKRHRVNTA